MTGYHVYEESWRAVVGEVLVCTRELSNMVDKSICRSGCEELDSYCTLAAKDLKSVLYISKQRRLDTLHRLWKLTLPFGFAAQCFQGMV